MYLIVRRDGRVPLARRLLATQRTRPVVAVVGVAVSVVLIIVVISLYRGWQSAGDAFTRLPGSVWVLQSGSRELFHTISQLDQETVSQVSKHPDVANAIKVRGRLFPFSHADVQDLGFFLAFDPEGLAGLPPAISARFETTPGNIVIDESFRRRFGVRVGDVIMLNGGSFRIAAETDGGNALSQHFAYLHWDDAPAVFAPVSATSYVVLTPRPGVSSDDLVERIGYLGPRVEAIRSGAIAQAISDQVAEMGTPVLSVVVVLAAAVGVVIVGLTMYTLSLDRQRDFALLKALGAEGGTIVGVVVRQSLLLAIAGVLLGLGGGVAISVLAERSIVVFAAEFRWLDLGLVVAAGPLVALIAALVPLRRVASADPASVFRA